MTAAAREFVTAATFQAVSGRTVRTDLWDAAAEAAMGHIELARWAELVLIAPASADFLARLAAGHANDLLSTLCLATEAPVAVAPAMNRVMWANPATRANIATLQQRGVHVLGPGKVIRRVVKSGRDACSSRSISPNAPVSSEWRPAAGPPGVDYRRSDPGADRSSPFHQQPQLGKDGIRRSAGRTGGRGGSSTRHGPVSLPTPAGVRRIDVESAADMLNAVLGEVDGADILFQPPPWPTTGPQAAEQKIKKTSDRMDLSMERTADVLATVAALPNRPFVVGFAAETESVEQHARGKLMKKNLDMIAANEVGHDKAFDCEDNPLLVLWRNARRELGRAPKVTLARQLVALIAESYAAGSAVWRSAARRLA